MKKLFKLLVLLIAAGGILWFAKDHIHVFDTGRVEAAGSVTFNLGNVGTGPMFTFSNIAPGFSESKTITVQNGDTVGRTIGVKATKSAPGDLDSGLEVTITEGSTILYGPKSLSEFYTDSSTINGVTLSTVAPNGSTSYVLTVTFPTSKGNEYQNQTTAFDLSFGLVTEVPLACEGIRFNKTIFGTSGNDNLHGTTGNDLIVGLEGNDKIDSGVGNDCIVGGSGTNTINGGVGNDIITGGFANKINAGTGDDVIVGGNGNDTIDGGTGKDKITSLGGDDKIQGGVGNDEIDGGTGSNSIDGGTGKDTCTNGVKKHCEM
jgi:Ca2+-binding RTX toxin-like protein